MSPRSRFPLLAVSAVLVLATSACGSSKTGGAAAPPTELKLGFFPNVTHSAALIGVEKGFIQAKLGAVKLSTAQFNAGPAAMEALLGGGVNATYVGPSPAVNTFVKSHGAELRIVSGASSGGASLVVQPGITDVAQLKGKKVATPQLGGTQDVAARAYFKKNNLTTDQKGGGDVSIVPQDNAQSLDQFKAKAIDAAWVPEPWASRLVIDGGGKVLVNENDLWPDKKFVTTLLVVRTSFLKDHPDQVKALIEANEQSIEFAKSDPAGAAAAVNAQLKALTTKTLADAVIKSAFENLTLTDDPLAATIKEQANRAADLGFIEKPDLTGILDLTILNDVRRAKNLPAIDDAGLGGKK
ncbi:MAG: aliphatic sulfonates family transporter, periplasmic ligand-binding protein [Frankiales bacterium]|nr:aliphatic sulfonates family transporter, periplasmic ligand-binding protein [Frankiales bacterium]